MSDEDILALAERERAFLCAANNVCAAAVMRELIERLRDANSLLDDHIKAMSATPCGESDG